MTKECPYVDFKAMRIYLEMGQEFGGSVNVLQQLILSFLNLLISQITDAQGVAHAQPPGRLQSILLSPGPIVIVISEASSTHELLAAQRLAHVLLLYHRIDSEIVVETVLKAQGWPVGNIVFIARPSSQLAQEILGKNRTPVRITDGTAQINQRRFRGSDQGLLVCHYLLVPVDLR